MKTKCPMDVPGMRSAAWWVRVSAVLMAFMLAVPAGFSADFPPASREAVRLSGVYKVDSSSDPLFQPTTNREYFLDFGSGASAGRRGGSMTISLRQNPNVRVRIMAWEYLPSEGRLLIGNPCGEGSRKAVALGVWRVRNFSAGVILERGNQRIILRRADPADY